MFTLRTKIALAKALITKRSPIYVQFAVTKRCNFSCAMCGSSVSRHAERDLSLSEIKKIADVLDRLNVGIVLLTGGEPFARPDIVDIIHLFSQKGFTVRLQTNGILATEDKITSACQAGMKEVTISLSSLIPERQDAVTGEQGSWYKIMEAITRFSQLLPTRGTLLGINTVVTKHNVEELPRMIKFVTAIGFYISLIPVHGNPGKENDFIIRKSAPGYSFTKEDRTMLERTYQKVLVMKKAGYHIYNSRSFLLKSPHFLAGERIHWHCDSPALYFSISPSGNFLPCVDLKTSFSMLDDNFLALYRSKEFQSEITEMVKKCPGCFYACYPEMTYLCRDVMTTFERIGQGCKILFSKRTPIGYEDCLRLAARIRDEAS